MKDVETKVSAAIAIGVRSSGKDSTRRYRVDIYREWLTKAKVEAQYCEEMLRLEEQKAGEGADRRPGSQEAECSELAAEIRVLRLQEQVGRLRVATSALSGKAQAMEEEVSSGESGSGSGRDTPVTSFSGQEEDSRRMSDSGCLGRRWRENNER